MGGYRIHCTEDRLRAAGLVGWVKRVEVDSGVREGITTSKGATGQGSGEIVKLASAFFAQAELDRRLKS